MKIIPLSEGTFTIDHTKQFVPFDEASEDFKSRSSGSLLVEIQPFVVITSNDILLLDTGIGNLDEAGVLQLHNNLKKEGIEPGQVTKVLLTHLHKDHAGGATYANDRAKTVRPSFTMATYYVQRSEMDFAMEKGFPSFIPAEILALKDNPRLEFLEGNGKIGDNIRYELTGGHSPFHQVFWIEEEGEIAFFGGDEAPQLGQMKSRFAAKYDHDGKKAMQLRQQWWQQGREEGWNFLFYHDFKTPVYHEKIQQEKQGE